MFKNYFFEIFGVVCDMVNNYKLLIIFFITSVLIAIISIAHDPIEYTYSLTFIPNQPGTIELNTTVTGLLPLNGKKKIYSSDFYENIIESTPFLEKLAQIEIGDSILVEYMESELRPTLKSIIVSIPFLLNKSVFTLLANTTTDKANIGKENEISYNIISGLKSRINININRDVGKITISALMQNKAVAKRVCDSLYSNLDDCLYLHYSLKKKRQSLFYSKLYQDAISNYIIASDSLSKFKDQNQNIKKMGSLSNLKIDRLDMNRAFCEDVLNDSFWLNYAAYNETLERPVFFQKIDGRYTSPTSNFFMLFIKVAMLKIYVSLFIFMIISMFFRGYIEKMNLLKMKNRFKYYIYLFVAYACLVFVLL